MSISVAIFKMWFCRMVTVGLVVVPAAFSLFILSSLPMLLSLFSSPPSCSHSAYICLKVSTWIRKVARRGKWWSNNGFDSGESSSRRYARDFVFICHAFLNIGLLVKIAQHQTQQCIQMVCGLEGGNLVSHFDCCSVSGLDDENPEELIRRQDSIRCDTLVWMVVLKHFPR